MYIFSYAVSDSDTNELYSEYHLGRRAFRYFSTCRYRMYSNLTLRDVWVCRKVLFCQ
jgi:hypothetical protein